MRRETGLCRAFLLAAVLLLVTASAQAADEPVEAPPGRVEITGVEDPVRDAIAPLMALYRERERAALSPARRALLHARAPAELARALQAFGYYRTRVESSLEEAAGGWTARYVIEPGPPLPVDRLELALRGPGAEDPALTAAVAAFTPARGQALVHERYETGKRALLRAATDNGYFDAEFTEQRVEVDLERYGATVRLVLETGERLNFGTVRMASTVVDGALLLRYVPFERGEAYSEAGMLALARALTDSGLFNDVRVAPKREGAVPGEVDVDVQLTPRPRNRYSVGAGFGTDTGPRGRLGWESRYVNSRGHRASVDLTASTVFRSLSGRYSFPGERPVTENWALTLSAVDEQTDTVDSQRVRLGAERSAERWGWSETLGLGYQVETSDVGQGSNTAGLLVPLGRWSRIWADDPLFTRRGLRLGLSLQGASEALLSDVTFLQARFETKAVHPVFTGGRLLVRGDFATSVVSEFSTLPASFRYYAGGDSSIRGFDFQSLGPRDARGKVIGGLHLAVASVEYEHPVSEKWRIAAFADAGNAFDEELTDIALGTGLGLRWVSPVGMVRVDVAAGVSEADTPVRLHVVLGPDL